MKLHRSGLGFVAIVSVAAMSGCVSTEKTVYKEQARTRVEFENDTAGRLFYEALSKRKSQNRNESKTEVSIPVVFEHKQHVIQGESVVFNEAVRECDTNQDGKITEIEARIFSERSGK